MLRNYGIIKRIFLILQRIIEVGHVLIEINEAGSVTLWSLMFEKAVNQHIPEPTERIEVSLPGSVVGYG
jgi:hypothetical protein